MLAAFRGLWRGRYVGEFLTVESVIVFVGETNEKNKSSMHERSLVKSLDSLMKLVTMPYSVIKIFWTILNIKLLLIFNTFFLTTQFHMFIFNILVSSLLFYNIVNRHKWVGVPKPSLMCIYTTQIYSSVPFTGDSLYFGNV